MVIPLSRSRALESGTVAESSLKDLPEPRKNEKKSGEKAKSKDRKLMELYKERSKSLTFTVVVLCIVIVILFVIRMFGTASPFADYEQKVLDEYAGWKEELVLKEEELHSWENRLTEWEQRLMEREAQLQ